MKSPVCAVTAGSDASDEFAATDFKHERPGQPVMCGSIGDRSRESKVSSTSPLKVKRGEDWFAHTWEEVRFPTEQEAKMVEDEEFKRKYPTGALRTCSLPTC